MDGTDASVGHRLLTVIAAIVALPLLLGGLIAAGESGDGRVLLLGTTTVLMAAGAGLVKPGLRGGVLARRHD